MDCWRIEGYGREGGDFGLGALFALARQFAARPAGRVSIWWHRDELRIGRGDQGRRRGFEAWSRGVLLEGFGSR